MAAALGEAKVARMTWFVTPMVQVRRLDPQGPQGK
jgi:hypothetical protein